MIDIIVHDNTPEVIEQSKTTVSILTSDNEAEEVETGGIDFTTWSGLLEKPFSTLGNDFTVSSGVLNLVKTDNVEPDNTLPITSAGVHREVGNIEALLNTI